MRLRRAARDADAAIQSGLDAIRDQLEIPADFPTEVLAAAEEAAGRRPSHSHADRTGSAAAGSPRADRAARP